MKGWIPKTCMLILLKLLVKRYNFKNKQHLARRKLQHGSESPNDLRDELLC
jgi:hypothetical protein